MELINRGAKEFQLTPQGNVFNEYAVKILDFTIPEHGIVPAAAVLDGT